MPSRHLDPEQSRRYAEHRYDFSRKSLAGRVVLVGSECSRCAMPFTGPYTISKCALVESTVRVRVDRMPGRGRIFSRSSAPRS